MTLYEGYWFANTRRNLWSPALYGGTWNFVEFLLENITFKHIIMHFNFRLGLTVIYNRCYLFLRARQGTYAISIFIPLLKCIVSMLLLSTRSTTSVPSLSLHSQICKFAQFAATTSIKWSIYRDSWLSQQLIAP